MAEKSYKIIKGMNVEKGYPGLQRLEPPLQIQEPPCYSTDLTSRDQEESFQQGYLKVQHGRKELQDYKRHEC